MPAPFMLSLLIENLTGELEWIACSVFCHLVNAVIHHNVNLFDGSAIFYNPVVSGLDDAVYCFLSSCSFLLAQLISLNPVHIVTANVCNELATRILIVLYTGSPFRT